MRFKPIYFLIFTLILPIVKGQDKFKPEQKTILSQVSFNPSMLTLSDSSQKEAVAGSYKSPGRASLFSLILPGTGELYLKNKKMASIFFGTELVLWSAYLLLNWYGDLKADDYKLYAVAHAGVDLKNKNHEFYVNIEDYHSLNEYNNAMLQQRTPLNMYPDDGPYNWSWDSNDSRKRFESLRMDSDRLKNTGLIMIGGILLNHLVSAIDAGRIARKNESVGQKDTHIYLATGVHGGLQMKLVRKF